MAENEIRYSAGTIQPMRHPNNFIRNAKRHGFACFKTLLVRTQILRLPLAALTCKSQRMPIEVRGRGEKRRHLREMCAAMFGQPRSAVFAARVSFSCKQLVLELFHVKWAVIPPQTSTIVASIKRNDTEKRRFLLQNGTDRFLFLRARRQWRDFKLKVRTILKAWTAWTVS